MPDISLRAYVEEIESMLAHESYIEAVAHCRHVLGYYPRYLPVYILLGRALLECGKPQDAMDIFQRVLSADPVNLYAHAGLAEIYAGEDNLDQATWHLERAFEEAPGLAPIQAELHKLYVRRDGQHPDHVRLTRGALARIYAQGELYPAAVAEAVAVLQREPDRLDMRLLISECLWHEGRYHEAAEHCLQVLMELPNCLVANRILADIWERSGRQDEAGAAVDRLQELDPYEWQHRGRSGQRTQEFILPVLITEVDRSAGTGAPGWARDIAHEGSSSPSGEGSFHAPAQPDWLAQLANSAICEATPFTPQGSEDQAGPAQAEELPEWLRGLASDLESVTSASDNSSAGSPAPNRPESGELTQETPPFLPLEPIASLEHGAPAMAGGSDIESALASQSGNVDELSPADPTADAAAGSNALPSMDWLQSVLHESSLLSLDSPSSAMELRSDHSSNTSTPAEIPAWLEEIASASPFEADSLPAGHPEMAWDESTDASDSPRSAEAEPEYRMPDLEETPETAKDADDSHASLEHGAPAIADDESAPKVGERMAEVAPGVAEDCSTAAQPYQNGNESISEHELPDWLREEVDDVPEQELPEWLQVLTQSGPEAHHPADLLPEWLAPSLAEADEAEPYTNLLPDSTGLSCDELALFSQAGESFSVRDSGIAGDNIPGDMEPGLWVQREDSPRVAVAVKIAPVPEPEDSIPEIPQEDLPDWLREDQPAELQAQVPEWLQPLVPTAISGNDSHPAEVYVSTAQWATKHRQAEEQELIPFCAEYSGEDRPDWLREDLPSEIDRPVPDRLPATGETQAEQPLTFGISLATVALDTATDEMVLDAPAADSDSARSAEDEIEHDVDSLEPGSPIERDTAIPAADAVVNASIDTAPTPELSLPSAPASVSDASIPAHVPIAETNHAMIQGPSIPAWEPPLHHSDSREKASIPGFEARPSSHQLVMNATDCLALARSYSSNGAAQACFDRYDELIAAGQMLDEVIADLEQLTAASPNDTRGLLLLGDAYSRNGRLQQALKVYRIALARL